MNSPACHDAAKVLNAGQAVALSASLLEEGLVLLGVLFYSQRDRRRTLSWQQ